MGFQHVMHEVSADESSSACHYASHRHAPVILSVQFQASCKSSPFHAASEENRGGQFVALLNGKAPFLEMQAGFASVSLQFCKVHRLVFLDILIATHDYHYSISNWHLQHNGEV
jgi:hypothetical protein